MIRKKTVLFLMVCILMHGIYARTAVFEGDDYSIHAVFAHEVQQGDPVFVHIDFTLHTNEFSSNPHASMSVIRDDTGKRIGKTSFYTVNTSASSHRLFAGIPLSTYAAGGSYLIRVEYQLNGNNTLTFDLPFIVARKDFINETLALDEVNTAIKTDVSEKRLQQIQELNSLLGKQNTAAVYADDFFIVPTMVHRRTSFFGDRRIYEYADGNQETNLHNGIDFGIPLNTEVYACGSGKVVMAEHRISTGWTIVIEHLPGLYSLYYHLNELNKNTGELVKKGELIALSGNTGLSTGPHLHWEIRLLGTAVNPDFFTTTFGIFF